MLAKWLTPIGRCASGEGVGSGTEHRGFAHKGFDGKVPEPGNPSHSSAEGLDNEDRALLAKVEDDSETEDVIEVHHWDSDGLNNRYINLVLLYRHCHDEIHGKRC